MKLMTQALEQAFAKIGDQSQSRDPIVVAKFFAPTGAATWWATEYYPEDRVCFGYVTGLAFDEWGTFALAELEALTLPLGLKIERDRYFEPKPISQAIPGYGS